MDFASGGVPVRSTVQVYCLQSPGSEVRCGLGPCLANVQCKFSVTIIWVSKRESTKTSAKTQLDIDDVYAQRIPSTGVAMVYSAFYECREVYWPMQCACLQNLRNREDWLSVETGNLRHSKAAAKNRQHATLTEPEQRKGRAEGGKGR